MSDLRLVHSELSIEMEQRLLRLHSDALHLRLTMTRVQALGVYEILERARDNLSIILDRADKAPEEKA